MRREQTTRLVAHLARALAAGLEAPRALRLVAATCSERAMQERLVVAAGAVAAGDELETALLRAGWPQSFLTVLEASAKAERDDHGLWTPALVALAEAPLLRERQRGLLVAELAYPLLVFLGVVAGALLLSHYVLPPLLEYYATIGASAPLATRTLPSLLRFGLPAPLVAGLLLALLWRVSGLGLRAHLAPPFVAATRAGIARSLGALLETGAAPGQALSLVGSACADRAAAQALSRAAAGVENGASLAAQLVDHGVVPAAYAGPLIVGEEKAMLPRTLGGVGEALAVDSEQAFRVYRALCLTFLYAACGALVCWCALSVLGGLY